VTPSFHLIRNKFVELCTISVNKHETHPMRKQACLDGLKICARMESYRDVELEICARKPEFDLLQRGADIEKYWAFRHADAQLGWFLGVLAAGNGSGNSARARMFYDKIVQLIERENL
jgi:hypothetical protein